jgi:serologically defined colon cancer antigen 8
MEGPNIVFESRINELEAHLTQMKIELKKAQEEASIYKSKLVSGDFSDRSTGLDLEPLQRQVENLRRYFTHAVLKKLIVILKHHFF